MKLNKELKDKIDKWFDSAKSENICLEYAGKREEHLQWWKTIDMNDPFTTKLWFQMFGTTEQRIQQLYIVRNSINLKTL